MDEAEPLIRRAMRIWKAAGDRAGVVYAMSALGRLETRRGNHDEALRLLNEAKTDALDIGAEGDVVEAEARIAECLALQGKGAEAVEVAGAALERVKTTPGAQQQLPLIRRAQGWAFLQIGCAPDADAALKAGLRVARDRNLEYEVALTQRAIARMGGPDADAADAESQEILERLGILYVAEPAITPA